MENAEEIFMLLEDFSKRKPKTIPQELNEYLEYVARTGDPIFQWSLVKCLFKEKLLNVLSDFYETSPGINIPSYPNVDPFNYDTLKNSLIERLDSFTSAPFTIQRLCELLTHPRKQYNRIDKYMRAIEKNILVVSTMEPGYQLHAENENGDAMVNGSDNNIKNKFGVEMEAVTLKETKEQNQNAEPQPSSSETYSIAEIEAHLRAKRGLSSVSKEKPSQTTATPQHVDEGPKKGIIPEQETSNLNSEALPSTSVTQNVDTAGKPEKTDKMDIDVKDEETASLPTTIPETNIKDISTDGNKSIDTKKDDVTPENKETSDKKFETEKAETEKKICESETIKDNNSDTPKAGMVVEKHVEEKEPAKMETDKPEPIPEKNIEITEKSPQEVQSKNDSTTVVSPESPENTESVSNESKSAESDQTNQLKPKETEEDKKAIPTVEEKVTEEVKTDAKSEKDLDTDKPAAPV